MCSSRTSRLTTNSLPLLKKPLTSNAAFTPVACQVASTVTMAITGNTALRMPATPPTSLPIHGHVPPWAASRIGVSPVLPRRTSIQKGATRNMAI